MKIFIEDDINDFTYSVVIESLTEGYEKYGTWGENKIDYVCFMITMNEKYKYNEEKRKLVLSHVINYFYKNKDHKYFIKYSNLKKYK